MSDLFFENIGIKVPNILLPEKNVEYSNWSVVACDQYTAQPAYWEQVEKIVDMSPSTFRITLPEIFLEEDDCDDRIKDINEIMQEYMDKNILLDKGEGFVLVERKAHGRTRHGLVVALDLEKYDYSKGSTSLIRATEGTVLERIPSRKKIRKNAVIETPHIMVLIDDPPESVIGELFTQIHNSTPLYDTKLMQGGGEIKGWLIDDRKKIIEIAKAIEKLPINANMLYAVGDGNHSLASAKAHWEDVKVKLGDKWEHHPARFALVELVNVHDKGLEFEPIHRVVFNCDYIDLLNKLEIFVKNKGGLIETKYFIGEVANKKMKAQWKKISTISSGQKFYFVTNKVSGIVIMDGTGYTMTVATLQAFLDEYLLEHSESEVDYIHGANVVTEISSEPMNLGIVLPPMSKFDLFLAVINEGALPRKTFSMGEANEKRYYMECRKIVE